ncbi:hypothetical protein CFIMG_005378RA [Ceratocystis fimbriata CBS 114723]|uniref:Uncharacterized protein n=1 Tax=Ceratocystis fimbriata CBS 114723 TaxID=1035309 RepID=A0A2C5WUV5_9PEZI|nr:hypothetical protein CFIMG_005378RA [Ceratocystis fimbriata CBS 114723]
MHMCLLHVLGSSHSLQPLNAHLPSLPPPSLFPLPLHYPHANPDASTLPDTTTSSSSCSSVTPVLASLVCCCVLLMIPTPSRTFPPLVLTSKSAL